MIEITPWRLALAFLMAIVPLSIVLWYRVPLAGRTLTALARMVAQLLFVGLYLKVVFDLDRAWLTLLWLAVMIAVADLSVIRGCGLRLRRLTPAIFVALLVGALPPVLYFTGVVLARPEILEAQYAIPIGGMVLGNCLRSVIVGFRQFFESLRRGEKPFLLALSQGATLREAALSSVRGALASALEPTIATIATIGLVSLPGMMTGVILAGADPIRAVMYQMVIMLAILTGTAGTLLIGLLLVLKTAFTPYGVLDRSVFSRERS